MLQNVQAILIQNKKVVTPTVLAVPIACFLASKYIMKRCSVGLSQIASILRQHVGTAP
jgi:hypothetical protein